jgi:hypothetical protein
MSQFALSSTAAQYVGQPCAQPPSTMKSCAEIMALESSAARNSTMRAMSSG